ncbi:MAG TPA: hypothetical protein VMI10_14345 [Terriglobales bacterium]|nr:hypothetical protein [Terriglobales bacterium]
MAVFTFKFDESYKSHRTLIVGGWIADDKQWKRVENRWQKAIAQENKTLPPDRQIKRYHAAEMNAVDGPFQGWDTARKNRFTNKLLKIVSNGRMTAACCGIDLAAFEELFPKRDPPDYAAAYVTCMGILLVHLAEAAKEQMPNAKIAVVHDHGPWDAYALQAYNAWIDDNSWGERDRFVGIAPLRWQDDVGLQAADLIAYESMRATDNELWSKKKNAPMRYALRTLLSKNVPIYGVYNSRDGLEGLAKLFEEKYGYKSGLSKITTK